MKKEKNYKFINKALFFPRKHLLVIGDLHLGYEHQMIQSGILTPKAQMQNLISELKELLKETKPKKIIFIGDIKHSFKYEYQEKIDFHEVIDLLEETIPEKNIIFIRGNHDTIDYSFKDKLKNYYIDGNIAFIHGHKTFPEIYDKKIKTIVMGHIHPSITFHDQDTSKRETYKCFLEGSFKRKTIIIMPSFVGISSGHPVNTYDDTYKDDFSIIPKNKLMNFNVHVIGADSIFEFGKLKTLMNV